MEEKKIAIVCDGKEISYGMNIFHLMRYEENGVSFKSEKSSNIDSDMYSLAAYRHTKISKKAYRIFVGKTRDIDPSMEKILDNYGMSIWTDASKAILLADSGCLKGDVYTDFLDFAGNVRNEYISIEGEYVKRLDGINDKWINKSFERMESGSLFKQNNSKQKLQQQYDCLAFVFYMEYFCEIKRQ